MVVRKIRFVSMRFEHHAGHSGYDRVAEFEYSGYETSVINAPSLVGLGGYYQKGDRMRHRIVHEVTERAVYRALEARAAARLIRDSDAIYHVLYGEMTHKFLGSFAGVRNNKIIATLHLPPSQYGNDQRVISRLKKLAAIVCVGPNQLDFFADIVGEDRVFYVPLGVDVDYFRPPDNTLERDPTLCLCVGNLYRDFPTLRGVVELVTFQRPETRFVLITSPKNEIYLGKHPNIEFRSGIPESELRQLYQSASLLVTPFYDGTANIAVTEAMACGLPIVSTDIGAVRDYVGDQAGMLVPLQDSRAMAEAALGLLEDPAARSRMSRAARERALEFAWPKMTEELRKVYDRISSSPG